MRILVVSHTYIVPLNREKLRILAGLLPDIEVTIVVPKVWQPGGVQRGLIRSEPFDEGNFRVVPLANFSRNNQGLLCFGKALVRLLQEFRPHIIHVEQGAKSLAYAQTISLNRLLGLKAKNVFFTWWNVPYTLRFPVQQLQSYNLRYTDGIVVGNQDGAEILRDHGYTGPMQVMPQLGVDETVFSPQPQPMLKASLGLQSDEFVIGFVGRFVPEKGLLTVARALTLLAQDATLPPWKWMVLGQGPLKPVLIEYMAKAGMGDRLLCLDSVPHAEVPQYLNSMDTLLLPSETTAAFTTLTSSGWKEQFGHVLIEAMACQVPVIGSDSGEIPHVIGAAGLVFPEGNAERLADCLREVMRSPTRKHELGQLGYQRVMTKYTNRALAKDLLSFYQELYQ